MHYADAAWKNKLATVPAAERRKAIAESRKRMVNTCVAEAWDPTLRACVQADGGDLCFPEAEYAWGFPAAGVMPTLTGSTECDEYFVALTKAQACSKIPEGTRDALAEGAKAMRQALDAVKNPDADTRRSFGTACRAGSDAVQQMLTSMGC